MTFEEFTKQYVETHKKMFESELGQSGQFDEFIDFAYEEYLKEQQ